MTPYLAMRLTPVQMIIPKVAKEYGMKTSEVLGRNQKKEAVWVRSVACYLLFRRGKTYTEIAKMVNRERATVMHHVTKIVGFLQVDKATAKEIERVESLIS